MNPVHPQILELGDPVLRSRCPVASSFDSSLKSLAGRMAKITAEAGGIGLAAPQLGELRRIVIVPGESGTIPLVNPQWETLKQGREPALEGCLSLPGISLPVEREVSIQVTARDLEGNPMSFQSDGLQARAIQHETDHLDGVLIIDRVPAELRWEAIWQLIKSKSAAADIVKA